MDRSALGMSFGEFWSERVDTHAAVWAWVGFLGVWIALYAGIDDLPAGLRLFAGFIGAFLVLFIYGLSCLVLVPLLPLLMLSWLSVWLEAHWRIRHRQPYVRSPMPTTTNIAPAVAPRCGGWLLPLVIGLWIGGTWNDDD